MKIAIRMDDITPDMDWDKFAFFQELFQQTGVTPLLGIVPINQDENLKKGVSNDNFWEIMRSLQQQGYVLALHGCHHIYQTKNGGMFPLNDFSEFAGRTYEEQKKDLLEAKAVFEKNGIYTDIFMAPAHSFDKNTLRALKDTGFTRITDGFGKCPYIWKGMIFYPISFLLSKSLKQKEGYTTMVLHANTVTDSEKERYRQLFKEHGKNMISYNEYLQVEPVQRSVLGRGCEYLLAEAKFLGVRIKR